MKEQLTFIRINSPDSLEEYSEFTVNTKELYSLLKSLQRCEEAIELESLKKELHQDSQFTEGQIQNLLDGALMWIAMDHSAEIMPYKALEITLMTQKLIALGASGCTIIKGGTTLLMKFIQYPERIEMLLNLPEGKRPDLDRVNINGDTALTLAVYNNYQHSAYQLLQAGANPAVRNHFGMKAAMYSRDFALIKALEETERNNQLRKEAERINQEEVQGAFFQPAPQRICGIL